MPDDTTPPAPGFTPTGYQRRQGGDVKWQPPTAEHLGQLFPQYEIISMLGHGGMGAVYKARQNSLDRMVAIKILPPELEDDDAKFTERFKNEARTMAKMNHPGIVSVYDFGETAEGQFYFVMEYVDGTDVAKMIQSSGKLPSDHALAITAHVCDALCYAHANGVIHRDIKPANILINMQGQVKVADFGLAKHEDASQTSGLTKTGMAMGTPDYVSPEALIMGMHVDGRADLYAVGVMLFQMLTGSIPRGMFMMPSITSKGETDPRFDAIIARAMQTDREMRYQSASELRKDLDVILTVPRVKQDASKAVAAVPEKDVQNVPDHRSAAHKPVARGPQKPAGKSANPEAPPQAKSKTPLFIGIGAVVAIAVGAFVMFSGNEPVPEPTVAAPIAEGSSPQPPSPKAIPPQPKADAPPAAAAKAPVPAKPEPPKSAVVAKAPEPVKSEPPKPIAGLPAMPKPEASVPANTSSAITNAPSPADKLPAELAALDAQFFKLQAERVSAPFDADLAKLNTGYLGGLDRTMVDEKKAGHLDAILALEAEKAIVVRLGETTGDSQSRPTMLVPESDDEKTPASLKGLRAIYRTAYAKLASTRVANLKALTDPLDKRLAQMESDFAKADRVADAKTVRGYREVLAESGKADGPPSAAASSLTALGGSSALPPGGKPFSPAAALALKDGFTNSLGMKLVPVPGTEILMCIHETRYKDYATYAAEAPGVDGAWKDQTVEGYTPTENKEDHPVMNVSWEEAQTLCAWLSKKEGKTYRLPTDQEWSIAVGIGRDETWKKDTTPATVIKNKADFPWGDKWPPPEGSGNYSDESRNAKAPGNNARYLEKYDDSYPITAPVMSFEPNKFGLYDLGGNVWEWGEDWYDNAKTNHVLRGGSWWDNDRSLLLSSHRYPHKPGVRNQLIGFRCVLATSSPAPSTAASPSVTPPPPATTAPQTGGSAVAVTKGKPFTNSLGMKFVPVPDTQAIFCIHETRRQDYAAYANEVPGVNGAWKDQQERGVPVGDKDDHPVVAVSWDDAQAFCAWLSKKEGKLYRLPTDREWSMAVGIAREEKWKADTTPFTVFRVPGEYPWGDKWPPPKGAGNYCDLSFKEALNPTAGPPACFLEYKDGFSTTAPVMSFKPNRYGLYDLGGNVWEWVEDWFDPVEAKRRTTRGASWAATSGLPFVTSSVRGVGPPDNRWYGNGFRVVLETTD